MTAAVADHPVQEGAWKYPYTPHPKQRTMHECRAQEILFGGAAGPGKTDALIAAGIMWCLAVPGAKVFLFRRTYRQIEMEILPRMLARIPEGAAKYTNQGHVFTFSNGSTFRLGYLAVQKDLLNYQGVEATLILWDELTQFTRAQYTYLRSRLRVSGAVAKAMAKLGWAPSMISSSNPAGPGHGWVKRMFVDPSPGPDQVFIGGIEEGEPAEGLRSMCYIPALASDNPYLDVKAYNRQLAGLDSVLRRAYMFGDWDVLQGVRFPDFRRAIHVIEPDHFRRVLQLPPGETMPLVQYPRVVGVDYGLSAPFAAVWLALLPDNLVVAYRELYATNLTAEQQARLILEAEEPGERTQQRPIPVALDPSTWARSHDQTAKSLDPNTPAQGSIAWWYRRVLGGAVTKADNDRIAGWHLIDHHMRVRADGLPRLLIMSNCKNLVRTLPEMQRSVQNPEDVGSSPKQDDHAVDSLRYGLLKLLGGGVSRVPPESPAVGERDIERERRDTEFDVNLVNAERYAQQSAQRQRLAATRGISSRPASGLTDS